MQPSLTTIQGECSTMAGASLMPKGIPSFLICACQINGGPYTVNVIPHECLWEPGGAMHVPRPMAMHTWTYRSANVHQACRWGIQAEQGVGGRDLVHPAMKGHGSLSFGSRRGSRS